MQDLVLFCKSFKRDFALLTQLKHSIEVFNKDKIQFVLCVPRQDIPELKNHINTFNCTIIADDEIVHYKENSWLVQQEIKLSFYKLQIAKNFVIIDSDSYFIKDFHKSDFLFDENTPFTICHEQKDLFEWTISNKEILGFDPKKSFIKDRLNIIDFFQRKNKICLDFGPTPIIWNSEVLKFLEKTISFEEALKLVPSEISWYGEALLKSNIIRLIPREPLFKVFHYKQQYENFIKTRTLDTLKENYLGVVLQSNWR